ncbi:MAG: hypothetical protein JW953_19025 [Anaerolineae bacterium]|nr:hypothetical protein [Anaerolineae bacterium]
MMTPALKTNKSIAAVVLASFVLAAFIISGFTAANFNNQTDPAPLPQGGPETYRLTNAIKNGDFEDRYTGNNVQGNAVAAYWYPYNNGGAHFGWYDEEWAEAVHSGKHAQLMEIAQVDTYLPERIIAIYQTVEVVPNMNYVLTIHALMRSDAPEADRNQDEYTMSWGLDYQGRGKYYFVQNWTAMAVDEQLRVGSGGPASDANHLYYQRFVYTIFTGNATKLTLFIRGMKLEPTGTELNFNLDDISMVGPYVPPTATPTPSLTPTRRKLPTLTPTPTGTPPSDMPITGQSQLPDAGATLPQNISGGAVAFGTLVLLVLGFAAANHLLQHRQK